MKRNFIFAAVFAVLAAASCEKEPATPSVDPETDLIGEITEDTRLEAGETYHLTGGLHVKNGATLTIEPGVTVIAKEDDIVDYILIEQGARIDAQGTADEPIVLTAEKKEAGSWGGIHICGKAPINVPGIDAKSEIGDASYGGDNAADNSGILRYVRVEYGGYAFTEEKESNGFTFYGVGNGTTLEYLQAYKGSDDGFEWFGGTANAKYLVSTDNTDDSFDWTEGWCGNAEYLVALQVSAECDCLIEADNNSNDAKADPVSHPVLRYLTLVGNDAADSRGIRLRAGTEAEIYNAIVTGKPKPLTAETVETETALAEGKSVLKNVLLSGKYSGKEGIYTTEMFLSDGSNKEDQNFSLAEGVVGKVGEAGAVSADNNWMKGWTR